MHTSIDPEENTLRRLQKSIGEILISGKRKPDKVSGENVRQLSGKYLRERRETV
jgi:hypothetical protein